MSNKMKPSFKHINIKKHLHRAVEDWLATLPAPLAETVSDNVFVTGGAIASMLMGDAPNDYDIYFKSKEVALEIANHYAVLSQEPEQPGKLSRGVTAHEYEQKNIRGELEVRVGFTTKAYNGLFRPSPSAKSVISVITDNAVTLKSKHQLVLRFHGSPDKVHETYDFLHCRAIYDHASQQLDIPPEVMEAVMTQQLIYTGSLYPLCSIFRVRKFLNRGWRISAGQLMKIAVNLQDVDFTDVGCLIDQLAGVDRLFMQSLVSELANRTQTEEGKPQHIDKLLICQLIDELERLQDDDSEDSAQAE